jgi:LmbE family N-acetylglucosaminyl deacetylase
VIPCSFDKLKKILCIGAHSDDVEIGCGGTILHLLQKNPSLEIYWLVLCSNPLRAKEARKSAAWFLKRAHKKNIIIKSFRDGFLPYAGGEVKDCFEELKRLFQPDLIFTHFRHDLHQDHRFLCELAWNTWRSHLILEYEIPKYDADLRSPNFFVPLTKSQCNAKVRALVKFFGSQRNKHWFSEDLFFSLLRIRGIESNSPTQFAEGFHCRKLVWDAGK